MFLKKVSKLAPRSSQKSIPKRANVNLFSKQVAKPQFNRNFSINAVKSFNSKPLFNARMTNVSAPKIQKNYFSVSSKTQFNIAPRSVTPAFSKQNFKPTLARRNFWVIDETLHYLGIKPKVQKTPAELSKELGVPEQLIIDPEHHLLMMRTQMLFQKLGIKSKEQQEKYLDTHIISPGHMTLEWTLPNPPPWHTFEEPIMIKEAPEGYEGH